jgi:hypothetical protein
MTKTKIITFKLIKSGDTPLSNTTNKYEMESKLEMLESLVPICQNVLFESERLSDVFQEDSEASVNVSLNQIQTITCDTSSSNLLQCKAKLGMLEVNCCIDTVASTVFIKKALFESLRQDGINHQTFKNIVDLKVKLGNSQMATCSEKLHLDSSLRVFT